MLHKNKKIGFFGGTFDPIHFGHIHLAMSLLERWNLDEVWFNPAFLSPFKIDAPPHASYHHRYEMLKRAFQKYPQFLLLDLEKNAKGPIYTIDAILTLMEKDGISPDNLYLFLGNDSLIHFNKWKEAKRLALLVHPLIGMRKHHTSSEELLSPFENDPVLYERFKHGLTSMPILEISSTAVRTRLYERLSCLHLIPAEVERYIHEEKLYLEKEKNHQHFEKQSICL